MHLHSSSIIQPTAARRKFGGYKREEPKVIRKADVAVRKDPVIEQLKRVWKAHPLESINILLLGSSYHEEVSASIRSQHYSAKDVEHFSLLLFEFDHEKNFSEKAGIFLTALVENGREEDFVIHTSTLGQLVNHLGKGNTKNILVKGDVGSHTATEMKKGKITIEGDEHGYAGLRMEGGLIEILGNAGEVIGWDMRNGMIIVHGNAEYNTGNEMGGGEIIVYGDVGFFTGRGMKGGRLRVKGNAGDFTGEDMEGGIIWIEKDSGPCILGRKMTGGEIHVGGECIVWPDYVKGGRIFRKGVLIVDK